MEHKWAERFRARLDQCGLTMKAASLEAGLNETFVRDMLERGRVPSIDKFIKLAAVIGSSVSDLLDEERDTERPIKDEREIHAMLSRIDGLGERGIELAMMTISTALAANRHTKSKRPASDDQSEPPIPRHESETSR